MLLGVLMKWCWLLCGGLLLKLVNWYDMGSIVMLMLVECVVLIMCVLSFVICG